MNFIKNHTFSILSSFYITIIQFVLITSFVIFFKIQVSIQILLTISIINFISCLLILQHRIKNLILKKIHTSYKNLSILNEQELHKKQITTNIDVLSEEISKFTKDKKIEIKQLNERNTFRRDFLGNISHELKTPLFMIQGYISILLDEELKNKKLHKQYLKRAYKGVDRLTAIVNDLDMIAQLETNNIKVQYETFNIIEVINNIFEFHEIEAKKKDITLKFNKAYELPVFVKGDEKKIEQVLVNLITNSIKYGVDFGETIISVKNYNKKSLIIAVKDNGEGIPKKHFPRLFERFYRVEQSRTRNQGGSGLGLSIVKHIIDAHKQTVFFNSIYGKGSEFSFTIEKAT